MSKSFITFFMMFILLTVLFLSGCSSASHEAHMHEDMHMGAQGSEQTDCPVMDGKIDKKIYVDHMDKRVYFCCKMCIAKFNEDPAKYMKKL